jgi:hypothetical protein
VCTLAQRVLQEIRTHGTTVNLVDDIEVVAQRAVCTMALPLSNSANSQ